jgi:hypothetical protein
MITVEDAADVAAFQNYVSPATAPVATPPPVAATVTASPPPPVAVPPPPPVAATIPSPPPPAAVPVTAAAVVTPAPPVPPAASSSTTTMSTAIPGMVYMNTKKSPLTHTLQTNQNTYISLYGTTGQIPIL